MIKFKSVNQDGATKEWLFENTDILKEEYYAAFPDLPSNDDVVFDIEINDEEIPAWKLAENTTFMDLYNCLVEPDIWLLLKQADFKAIEGGFIKDKPASSSLRRIFIGYQDLSGYAVKINPSECGYDLVKCTKAAIRMRPDEIVFQTNLYNDYLIRKALKTVSREDAAKYFCSLLTDEDVPTYEMFDDLASCYLKENEDVRKGIDLACSILTQWNLSSISRNMLTKYK